MTNDNKKYIAEAWIENIEEEDFKKSFLKSLIKQWQGHTNGFDADTVDGQHYEDIVGEIENRTYNLMTTFNIGYTVFSREREKYTLGFDAIALYDLCQEDYTDEQKTLPWDPEPREDPISLLDVFYELYSLLYLGGDGETRTNKEIFDEFNDKISRIETYVGGKFTSDGQLNADCVNGIRFFIYTPEQYETLELEASEYNPELYDPETKEDRNEEDVINSYKKLNSLNNVFIIKTEEEIIAGGYESGVYDFNPDTNVVDKHYKFRVGDKVIGIDEETQEPIIDKWLQYCHDDGYRRIGSTDIYGNEITEDDVWQDLCPADDFINPNRIKEILEGLDFEINPTSLTKSLKNIGAEVDDIPFIRNNFLYGGVYNNGDEENLAFIPNTIIDNYKYLDLTELNNSLQTQIDNTNSTVSSISSSINGTNGIRAKLNRAESKNSQQDNKIDDLEDSIEDLASLRTKISNLERKLNTAAKWVKYKTNYSHAESKRDGQTYYWYTECSYNDFLGLCYLRLSIDHYHTKGDTSNWMEVNGRTKPSNKDKQTFIGYRPWGNIMAFAKSGFIQILEGGKIMVKMDSNAASGWYNFVGNIIFASPGTPSDDRAANPQDYDLLE